MSADNQNRSSGDENNQDSVGENENVRLLTNDSSQPGYGNGVQNANTKRSRFAFWKNKNGDGDRNKTDAVATDTHNSEAALANDSILAERVCPEGFNMYRNKKTLTQGLMDIALFSVNANQLRYILEHGATNAAYFYIVASLIIISIILQVGVGMILLISTQYDLNVKDERKIAYRYGNYVVIGIFLITAVNIFIATFGGPAVAFPNPPATPFPINNATGT